jgi:hypothetical protein
MLCKNLWFWEFKHLSNLTSKKKLQYQYFWNAPSSPLNQVLLISTHPPTYYKIQNSHQKSFFTLNIFKPIWKLVNIKFFYFVCSHCLENIHLRIQCLTPSDSSYPLGETFKHSKLQTYRKEANLFKTDIYLVIYWVMKCFDYLYFEPTKVYKKWFESLNCPSV